MSIGNRLKIFADSINLSVRQLEMETGASNGTFAKAIKDSNKDIGSKWIEKIISNHPELNVVWLISGKGTMKKVSAQLSVYHEPTDESIKDATPYYNINVFAGQTFSLTETEYITGYITLPDMPPCDCAITVYGQSMEPMIANGDIILCKEVLDKSQIHFGAVYLIITNELRVVKYIRKGDNGNIMLWSQNKHHDPFEVAIAKVRKLFSVKAIVKKVGM